MCLLPRIACAVPDTRTFHAGVFWFPNTRRTPYRNDTVAQKQYVAPTEATLHYVELMNLARHHSCVSCAPRFPSLMQTPAQSVVVICEISDGDKPPGVLVFVSVRRLESTTTSVSLMRHERHTRTFTPLLSVSNSLRSPSY